MATIVTQRTWVTGEVVTAAYMNTNVRDAINFLMAPPLCILRSTAGTQTIPTATFTDILWDTEDIDTDNGHSTSTNTNRYTAQTPGWYDCRFTMLWPSGNTGLRDLRFVVNGTTAYRVLDGPPNLISGNSTTQNASSLIYLNAGDYITCQGRQDSGATLTIAPIENAPRAIFRWINN